MEERRRGLVIDVSDAYVVVLSADGAFLRVPRRDLGGSEAAIGTEVGLPLAPTRPGAWQPRAWAGMVTSPGRRRWVALAAAVLLGLTLPAISYWHGQNTVYAHVSVDLSSGASADLAVNASGRVLAVILRGSGAAALEDSETRSLAGRDLADVVQALVAPAIGEADSDAAFVIAVAPVAEGSGSLPPALEKKVDASRKQVKAWLHAHGHDRPTVVSLSVSGLASETAAVRSGASEAGLSLGQYLLYLEASKVGIKVDLSKAREGGVAKAIHDAGLPPGQVVKAAAEEKDFVKLYKENRDGHKGDHGDGHGNGHGDGQDHGSGGGDNQGGSGGQSESDGHGDRHGGGDGGNGSEPGDSGWVPAPGSSFAGHDRDRGHGQDVVVVLDFGH